MKPRWFLLLVGSLLLDAAIIPLDAAASDRDLLQGHWLLVAAESEGKKQANKDVQKDQMTFVFAGDGFSGGDFENSQFQIDPDKAPKQLTLTKPEMVLGIYKVEGDRLTICVGETERPTDFTTRAKDGRSILVLQRISAAEAKEINSRKVEDKTVVRLWRFRQVVRHYHQRVKLPVEDGPLAKGEPGAPFFSWRVRLLEYDDKSLWKSFVPSQPWDDPKNKKLLSQMPVSYCVPGRDKEEVGVTHFRRVLVPERKDLFIVVEAVESVPWTKPGTDLVLDAGRPLPRLGGALPDGFFALCGDGNVRFIKSDLDNNAIRAALLEGKGVKPYDVPALLDRLNE